MERIVVPIFHLYFFFSSPPPPQLSKMTPNLNSSLLAHPLALGQGHLSFPSLLFANFFFLPLLCCSLLLIAFLFFFFSADPKSALSAHWAKAAPCVALHDRGRPKRGADPMIRIDRVSERRLSKRLESGQPWCGIDGM